MKLITHANFRGPSFSHGLTLLPSWISIYIHCKLWDEIINPFSNFNGCWVKCGVVCVELARLNLGDREDIFMTHLITIIKWKVSIFLVLSNFSVVVRRRWLYHQILSVLNISRDSWVLCMSLFCSLMMRANHRVHYGPMVVFAFFGVTLHHYHHYADVSGGIGLLECLSDIFSLVCVCD